MTDTPIVRFAPSPTGHLHVGNARMALMNALFATRTGGRFLLRLDDTDAERSTTAFADAIQEDLAWLGMQWDAVERQSGRMDRYAEVLEDLKASGRVYPCFESAEELDYMRKRLRAQGKPPVYTPGIITVDDADKAARTPHWRFKLEAGEIAFDDLVRGAVSFDAEKLSDPVVVREDGSFLYMLPSAVDDADFKVSHVVRGEDHVTNSAVQIQMFLALGATPPAFAHTPLLTDISGAGLSKRLGSITLASMREDGVEPLALASYLARLGTSHDIELADDMAALAGEFDFAHINRGTPKFDPAQLTRLNAQLLHGLSFDDVADRLSALNLTHADAAFWDAVRGNVERIGDSVMWHDVCFGTVTPVIEDADFAAAASALLPPEPWDDTTWKTWTTAVKEETGAKGKGLFMPLRLALTGVDHGPELRAMLPLIGRDKALARLAGGAA